MYFYVETVSDKLLFLFLSKLNNCFKHWAPGGFSLNHEKHFLIIWINFNNIFM